MKRESTFIGWNNGNWIINEGFDYPHLAWQATAGTSLSTDYPLRTYAGGGWQNPYRISTPEDLVCLMYRSNDWSGDFVLVNDIDMSSVVDYLPPAYLSGTFDGQNHTISNLRIDPDVIGNHNQLGFIGCLSHYAQIKNLLLEQFEISGFGYIGGICGYNFGAITDCHVTGDLYSNDKYMAMAGGVCGYNYGTLNRCSAECDLIMDDAVSYCGGVCGWNQEIIRECYSAGMIHCGENNGEIGGFCGYNRDTIEDCYSLGAIYCGDGNKRVGGFCGDNSGQIDDCYASVDVISGQDCDEIGGLCGSNYGSGTFIRNCFWNSEIQTGGIVDGIGIEKSGATHTHVFAKDTLQMRRENTYTSYGWDFVADSNGNDDIWTVCEAMNYPRFVWQTHKGDFVCPDGVGIEDYSEFSRCWLGHLHLESELDDDGDSIVGLAELARLGGYWLRTGCGHCGGMDMTGDGDIAVDDLGVIADEWLLTEQPECWIADMNQDDYVGIDDLYEFISYWLEGR
jgi:hypothetical protein